MIAAWPATAQTPTRPNVILIMADDMGWGEVGFPVDRSPGQTYDGHPVLRTPQLSAMADAGLTFNRFYAADSVCSPTRASFVTGRHHDRVNVPGANKGHLPNREMTIAEVAQTQGYMTGHFGKWHLGALDKSQFAKDGHRGGTDRAASVAHYSTPWDSGYDTAFVQESASQTFNPYDRLGTDKFSRIWTAPGQAITDSGDPRVQGDSSQRLVDQTLSFAQDAVANNRPFLTTVWFTTPHNHLASDPSDTTYGTATNQDDIRNPAVNNDHRWTSLSEMDRAVGRIRAYLQDPNGDGNTSDSIADNTILVFTSDNGGNWRADSELDSSDRNDGNGGLRGEKGHLYEGGVRVPGIFEWPGQIVPNRSTNAIAGVIDLFPTLMDIWDLDAPDTRPMDGESLVPVLLGKASNRTTSMKWSHGDRASIVGVDGKFKAVKASQNSAWELYDLLSDPEEKKNLAGDIQYKAKLNELTAQFATWKTGVERSRDTGDYASGVVRISGANLYPNPFDNPSDFTGGAKESDTPTLFVERQLATLRSDLNVDLVGAPGQYASDTLKSGVIETDTVVDSYLLHFDPSTGLGAAGATVTLQFENEILGVIAATPNLVGSDFLAFAVPKFEGSGSARSALPSSGDLWTIAPDGKTITLRLEAGIGDYDQLRIITKSDLQRSGQLVSKPL